MRAAPSLESIALRPGGGGEILGERGEGPSAGPRDAVPPDGAGLVDVGGELVARIAGWVSLAGVLIAIASRVSRPRWSAGTRAALLAVSGGVIGSEASYLIQATTLLTFICSSYLVMFRYPTPIAVNESLRRD